MTYLKNLGNQQIEYRLALADLSLTTYSQGAVYSVSNATGNLNLSISSGVITLPAGRYMLEAYPYVNQATTSDEIVFTWQRDFNGSYSDIGIEGQVQVQNDDIGERDVALASFSIKESTNIKLIVKTLTSTGTPTDEGGCVVIWKEEVL